MNNGSPFEHSPSKDKRQQERPFIEFKDESLRNGFSKNSAWYDQLHGYNYVKMDKTKLCQTFDRSDEELINKIISVLFNENPFQVLVINKTDFVAKSLKKYFSNSNYGRFEYYTRAGKTIFKIEHDMGKNGTVFFKEFLKAIILRVLKREHFHFNTKHRIVSLIFR